MTSKKNSNFRKTEIGIIPEDWQVGIFEKDLKIKGRIGWRGYKTSDLRESGPAVIGGSNLKSLYFIKNEIKHLSREKYEESPDIMLKKGDVLLVTRGSNIGDVGFFDNSIGVATINPSVIILSDFNGDSRFLFYYLISQQGKRNVLTLSSGSSVPAIYQADVNRLKYPKPPFHEQQKIADFLFEIDRKIELNFQMNKTLEQLGQTIFKRWFVDFEFPDEEGKPYKSSGGKMVYNDELEKEIPKNWVITKLGNVIRFLRGVSYKSVDLRESENALVSLKAIERGGGFNTEGLKPFTGNYKEEQVVESGDIVVAHTDLTQKAEVLGKPALIRKVPKFKTLIASMDLGIVRPNDKKNRAYIYYLLKSSNFQNHIVGYANGTTVLHLSNKGVSEYNFSIPPNELMDRFGKIVNDFFKKMEQNAIELETLIQLREALLPKLMSGKIRVPIVKDNLEAS